MPKSADGQSICFGKLPIAGDFLRGDGAAPEFGELDDWIQHGMYESQQRVGAAWQETYDALPPARFVWTAGEGPVIAGWWHASRDAVGRRYPFLFAARLPDSAAADLPLVPLALREWFGDAAAMLERGFDEGDVVGAIDAMQGLACRPDFDGAREAFARLDQERVDDAWSGHPDAPELLLYDLEQVAGQATPPQYALRWPTRGRDVDVAFWLTLMARFGNPNPRLVLWHEGSGERSGSLRAVLCALQPRLFPGVLCFDREDDDAYDMGRGDGGDGRGRDATARFGEVVRAGHQAHALQALSAGGRR